MQAAEDIIWYANLGKDREGVDSWADPVTYERSAIPWPRTSAELDEGGTVIGENVWMPGSRGVDISAEDQIILRGVRYALDGKPGEIRKAGRIKGFLLTLKAIQ